MENTIGQYIQYGVHRHQSSTMKFQAFCGLHAPPWHRAVGSLPRHPPKGPFRAGWECGLMGETATNERN